MTGRRSRSIADWALVLLFPILTCCGWAQRITVELRNGDRLTGSMVAEDSRRLILQTEWKGKVTIPQAEVLLRSSAASPAHGPAASKDSGATASVAPGSAPEQSSQLDQLFALYIADKISARQYHEERAKLLASAKTPDSGESRKPGLSPSSATNAPPLSAASLASSATAAEPAAKTTPAPVPAAGAPTASNPPAPTAPAAKVPPTTGGLKVVDAPAKPKPKSASSFHGEVQFGMEAGFNTAEYQTYTGRLTASQAIGRFHNVFDYAVTYGKANEVLSADRMDGNWRLDFDLRRRLFAYATAGAGYDHVRKVDLYYKAGPGFGYKIVTRTNFMLNGTFGSSYQDYAYADEPSHRNIFLSLGEDFTWTLFSKITLVERLEFMPRPENFNEYRLRVENTLRFSLSKSISLNLNVVDFYDTSPAKGVSNNDLQIRSMLGVRF